MIKLSKRLAAIASFCNKDDKVIDIGCDHGLLSVYLYNKVKKVLATDINPYSLEIAQKNFLKYEVDIQTILSDGIDNVDIVNYDTLVMAGMGFYTIRHILEDEEKLININKIIISSHNHQELVREYLNKIGFYLRDEEVIYDKHYYTIMEFIKGKKKHRRIVNKYGLIKKENILYYQEIVRKDEDILQRQVDKKTKKKLEEEVKFYKNVIEKIGEEK